MRLLHFDCFSGISGDMALGALIDAGADEAAIRTGLDSLGLPIQLRVEKIRKSGFAATQVTIEAAHEHKHRHLHHIEEILASGKLTPRQREIATAIFSKLAAAEAVAHGLPIEKVHFHEVGALDSIADIVGFSIALENLAVEHVSASSVPTGRGRVRCEHGWMPVPAPGTAELLKGVPLRSLDIEAELTTPTGAAILAATVDEWTDTPEMVVEHIGYGSGQRDLAEQPNLLRIFVGNRPESSCPSAERDQVWVLETNIDDATPEVVGYCFERVLACGALDVFATPVVMKKNRPGLLLTVLADDANRAEIERILFAETGTLGIRRRKSDRAKLPRETATVETRWGSIAGKLAHQPDGTVRFTPEYEACVAIARTHGVPLLQVYTEALTRSAMNTPNRDETQAN